MSYFGGIGAGKGWLKFKFILTPDEFKSIFNDLTYWFVITNTRVDITYQVNDNYSVFSKYNLFFDKVISGEEWTKEDASIESGIHISIVDDSNSIKFEPIVNKRGEISSEFKLVSPEKPVINMSPFYLSYSENSMTVEPFNAAGIIGIEINYPKLVSFSHEKHELLHDTTSYYTKQLFDELVDRIKSKSHKAKISRFEKTFRPNFWISKDAATVINKNHYLTSNNLTLS